MLIDLKESNSIINIDNVTHIYKSGCGLKLFFIYGVRADYEDDETMVIFKSEERAKEVLDFIGAKSI